MKILFSLLKQHRIACVLAALLLCAQALLCLASPALLGALVHTGMQKQGFDDALPQVLSRSAYDLFARMLPPAQKAALDANYTFAGTAPAGTPERYTGGCDCYYLNRQADTDAMTLLYRNAVWAAILAAREGGALDKYDLDELVSQISLRSMVLYAESVSFSEEDVRALYEAAERTEPALKVQTAALLLPFIYEDAGLDCASVRSAYVTGKTAQLIVCAVLQFAAAAGASALVTHVSAQTERGLRERLTGAYLRLSRQETAAYTPDRLSYLQRQGVTQIGMSVRYGFRLLFYAPVLAAVGSVLTFRKSVPFGLLILGGAAFIIGAVVLIYAAANRRYYRMQRTYETYASHFRTVLRQLFAVRSGSAQDYEAGRIGGYSAAIRRDESFVMRAVLTGLSAAGLTVNLLTAVVVAVGLKSMLGSDMNIGDILTYMQYAVLVVTAFMMLGLTVIFAPKALIALKDVERILTAVPALAAYDNNDTSVGRVEAVTFDGVRLFPGAPVVSFTARRGALTLMTGGTGTGKSLLIDALLREYAPAEGRVLLDGTDITALSAAYPADTVVHAGSRPVLYSASVRRNLRLHGATCGDEGLLDALAKAECGFLVRCPQDLDTVLENAGEALSGGQRSRLSMAACFARQGGIYVFDDCLTAVDHALRLRILERIAALKQNAVVILITQDDADLPEADQRVEFYPDRVVVRCKGGAADG